MLIFFFVSAVTGDCDVDCSSTVLSVCCFSVVSEGNDVPYSGDISPTESDVSVGAEVGGGEDGVSRCSCSKLGDVFNWRSFFDLTYHKILEKKKEYGDRLTGGEDGSNIFRSLKEKRDK